MSEKFLKGIFLVFGFCFFLQTLWMIGANFGIAEPFCLVIGKNALRCVEDGQIKASAKQFCLGKPPFGSKYKKDKSKQTESLVPPFDQVQQYQGYPQGAVTQEQMRAQQQQFLLQQQQLQAQRQAQAKKSAQSEDEDSEEE